MSADVCACVMFCVLACTRSMEREAWLTPLMIHAGGVVVSAYMLLVANGYTVEC